MPAEYRAQIEASRPRLEQIAREQYGLMLQPGPFGISSRAALVGAKFAEAQGVGEAYNLAVLQAYWQEGRDIGDTAVLTTLATSIGISPANFTSALQDPQWTEALLADVQQAYDYGLSGVPALILADKYLISGAQPYELLARAVTQIAAQG
jgi:predicted DsbA family dithiol-disulfide isomerase